MTHKDIDTSLAVILATDLQVCTCTTCMMRRALEREQRAHEITRAALRLALKERDAANNALRKNTH